MALLLGALLARGAPTDVDDDAADGLAKHLSLLFVPAGAGVMLHVAQIEAEWVPIVVAIGVSARCSRSRRPRSRSSGSCAGRSARRRGDAIMITHEFFELWVYLAATPLAGLTLTLVAYAAGWWCYTRCGCIRWPTQC